MASMNPELESIENNIESMERISVSDPPTENNDTEKKSTTLDNKFSANILVSVRENVILVKRFIQDLWLQFVRGEGSEKIRAYQVWPGNNVFFFHGRFICGPDPKGLILTTISIILSSLIFAIYTAHDLPSHSSLIITIFLVILTLLVLINLILVSTTDPGIIPRNDQTFMDVDDDQGSKRIVMNGVEIKLKYCRICKIYRPPRSCHCAICDNCVEKFDHHCPWLGQCIALRNYRVYLTFVMSALIFFIYIFTFSVWRIHYGMIKDGGGLIKLLNTCPETLALLSFSFAAIWLLSGLLIFHVYLTAVNQTAYENFRQRYADSPNPFDKGILSNIKEVLCVPMRASRVDFRAEVMRSTCTREV